MRVATDQTKAGVLVLLGLLPLASGAAVPLQSTGGVEGPLNNDSFQPTNLTAEELFHSGLRDLDAGRQDFGFESLRSALGASNPGDGLRLPAAGGTPRTVLGVESAVRFVLDGFTDEELGAWCSRFDELAREGTAQGAPPEDIERRYPGTEAALRAALIVADEALEAGRIEAARTYLERAERHAAHRARAGRSAPPADSVRAAIERRRSALDALAASPTGPTAEHRLTGSWDQLTELPRPRVLPFEFAGDEDPYLADLIGSPTKLSLTRGPGLGLRPGLAPLGPARVAVQTAAGLHVLDLSRAKRDFVFEPKKLVEAAFGRIGLSRSARKGGEPGWPHVPRVGGDKLVVVVGRTESGRAPNALCAISIPGLSAATTLEAPVAGPNQGADVRADWILSGSRLFRDGRFFDPDLLEPLDGAEIQPGPAIVGDRLVFQARVLDGDVRTYLVAVSLADGEPLWTRLVAKGGDLGPSGGARFVQARLPLGAAAELVVQAGAALVQTNLGISALFDVADGRLLWSFLHRRRDAEAPGWSGLAPLVLPRGGFAVAPADSDFAYQLAAKAPESPASTPLLASPIPLGSGTDLVAAETRTLISFALAGGERQLSELRLTPAGEVERQFDSVLLRRDERFVGLPAVGPKRILASSNRGLFLFDRTRELFLLDYLAIPSGAGPREAGGEVLILGDRLLVLGPGTLWIFEP